MHEVTSTETLDQVRHALEKANVESTENADLALPSYKVLFLKDKKIVQTLGYYPKDKNHDTDAFLSLEENQIYRLPNSLSLVP
ncbi:hypothetical protein GLW07_13995 [Bacillus hwajinpoensis]|uniref:Uncharacterized protein n=1 Tax=Guptibacillus hwajinpoensis TaxID=208199 RepID=A0A845F183_9BACL|nr:hypothetical protein [Pseudalkalibacillus hwajinpoensis]MYL64465.1 hypothetical protein [Pseudalkalibacillus hwajinpoensis]